MTSTTRTPATAPFAALVAHAQNDVRLQELTVDDLAQDGDVLVEVTHSSLNYKDALAITGKGRIARKFPLILGIDLAGTVVETGERVVGVGQGLGESDGGGYTRFQRVKRDALVPLPAGMSAEQAMQLGTAGFTAMLAVMALDHAGVTPGKEVVVTGAAGGVGSIAVMLLAKEGHHVVAVTGRPELEPYLKGLGATTVIAREELTKKSGPLQSERWGGGIDTVGGEMLANLYAQTAYEGAIACCGMAASHELATTVWPLILRNVSLLGISSIRTSMDKRVTAWNRLAGRVDFGTLAELSTSVPLTGLRAVAEELLAGRVRGRTVVEM
ncbi:MAG TPA: MDR family oxidoreductase [Thermoanaerobaculia bacterium]|jgi:putative YhdH/YhfP family quinone oxidoreductase